MASRTPKSKPSSAPKKTASKRQSASAKSSRKGRKANSKAARPRVWKRWLWRLCLVFLVALAVYLVYLDAQIRERFEGNKWDLPAKVYARPFTLYPGLSVSEAQLQAELQWADYRRDKDANSPGSFDRRGDDWLIYRRAFAFWDGAEPARQLRIEMENGRVQRIWDAQGEQALVRLEPQYIGGIFPSDNEDRELVRLEDVPPELVAALIITEDQSFFQHWGISLRGIARAMMANVRAGGMVQGGSTLTQQLVKNFFLTSERTLTRKAQEALMSILLELHYDKEEILQAYLNEVYLGQAGRRAIHGFGLAARFYFGKSARELSLAESATLVGLVKGASYYNPRRHPQRAKQRRDLILGLMADNGIISDQQRRQAQAQPLLTSSPRRAGQREYPAFLELAKQQLQRDYRLQDLQSDGLNIFTTLDPWIQHAVERAAEEELQRLERRFPEHDGQLETAAVVTSVDGGEIRALLGSRKAEFFGFNRALDARRPMGSLVKPAVFLAALNSGRYHWASPISDRPVVVTGPGGQRWEPKNYDLQSHGDVTLEAALHRSLNQATARLGMTVGLEAVASTLQRLGFEGDIPPYPSMLLGAVEGSPVEVASFYQTMASQGFYTPLRTIAAVTTSQGQTLSSYAIEGEQRYAASSMQWLRYGLEQVVESGTARRLQQRIPVPLAAKTGTSDEQRDAWFAGFDNRHLGVFWVGRDDNKPMPVSGSSGALPLWLNAFERIGVEGLTPAQALAWYPVLPDGTLLPQGCKDRRASEYPFTDQALSNFQPDVAACASGQQQQEEKSWFDWLF
ncbi:penicillin-binding protein 1B [Bacterioplanes sanyensis]|nr:penicillin-binding protein 1B [Bacterioplanes sanyensis]